MDQTQSNNLSQDKPPVLTKESLAIGGLNISSNIEAFPAKSLAEFQGLERGRYLSVPFLNDADDKVRPAEERIRFVRESLERTLPIEKWPFGAEEVRFAVNDMPLWSEEHSRGFTLVQIHIRSDYEIESGIGTEQRILTPPLSPLEALGKDHIGTFFKVSSCLPLSYDSWTEYDPSFSFKTHENALEFIDQQVSQGFRGTLEIMQCRRDEVSPGHDDGYRGQIIEKYHVFPDGERTQVEIAAAGEPRKPSESSPSIESAAAAEKIFKLDGVAELLDSPKWIPTPGGATFIQSVDDKRIITRSHGSSTGASEKYSYFVVDRWTYAIESSFDCACPPNSIRIESFAPIALEGSQTLSLPASIKIEEIAANLETYFADKHPLNIRQLEDHVAINLQSPPFNLALSRKVAQPELCSDLLEVVDICLGACKRLSPTGSDAPALQSYLAIGSWCMQILVENKLRNGELSIATLADRLDRYRASTDIFADAISAGAEKAQSLDGYLLLHRKKIVVTQTLLDDYREITSEQNAAVARKGWLGSRENKLREEARVATAPQIVLDRSETMRILQAEFSGIIGGSDSNNLGGDMRLITSQFARRDKVSTVISWRYSSKPLGLLIDGHPVAGMHGGQIGVPELEMKAAGFTYDVLETKKPRVDGLKGMVLWLPEEMQLSVNPQYGYQHFDSVFASKSLFEL